MKNSLALLAAALSAALGCAAAQAQNLSATLIAPTELNLGAVEIYQAKVRNTSATATAFNVVVRMNLPAGLELQAPVPAGCTVTTEAFGATQGVRQVKCMLAGIGGGKTRTFDLFVLAQSQPAGNPIAHRVRATHSGSTVVGLSSLLPPTQYQNFVLPIVPGSIWTTRHCWAGNEVPHAICLPYPSSSLDGEVRLAVGGIIDSPLIPGPSGMTWLQTSPTELRYDEAPDPVNFNPGGFANMRLVNSRCFRGHGISNPVPGEPPIGSTGIQFCLK